MKPLLFISDLHLDAAVPRTLELFRSFCREQASAAQTLYILGDLFEAWIGDDADDLAAGTACDALAELSALGTDVLLLQGNRDFLLGERFADRCGARLLPEPSVIVCGAQRIVLCHGDSLCTGDADYQALRQRLRDPAAKAALLARPRNEREALARQARQASREAGANKPEAIMDVTGEAVDAMLDALDADVMIHGHTHRPGDHRWQQGGHSRRRLVLGAWTDSADYVIADGAELRLRRHPQAGHCGSETGDPPS